MSTRGLLAVVALTAAACGEGNGTATPPGESAPTTSTPTSIPAASPVPQTAAPSTAPLSPASTVAPATSIAPTGGYALLVVDRRGVRLWSESDEVMLLQNHVVGSALPDHVGGIIFQDLETGAWRPEAAPAPSTASWRWVGSGSPQPIRWLPAIDGADEVVVEAPTDGWVQPVDTAVVNGHPTLAFVRTRYTTITSTDDNPWWGSATAELVVRDLVTATEQVVRTQDVGWEHDYPRSSLGEGLVADFVNDYGGGVSLDLWEADGTSIETPYELTTAVADLPSTGQELVQAIDQRRANGELVGVVDVTVMDPRTGVETLRASVDVPTDALATAIDRGGDRSLLLAQAPVSATPPTLRPGDAGSWVVALQQQLNEWLRGRPDTDDYVTPDGVFGLRTAAAVGAVQETLGEPVTEIADETIWQAIGGSGLGLLDPYLIEGDGSVRQLAVFDAAGAPTRATRVAPHLPGNVVVSLWSP